MRDQLGKFVIGHKTNLGKKMNPLSIKKAVQTKKSQGIYEVNSKRIRETFTGKTYEQIYGIEKAKQIKNKISIKSIGRIPPIKGKTYEIFFGEDVAENLKEQIKIARKKQIFPMNDTKIEIKIQDFLKELKIVFYPHHYISDIIHSYQSDIFIPSFNVIIECDGDYWHFNPKKYINPNKWQKQQIEEDKIRTKELIEKGYKIIRLWETDIKQMNLEQFKEVLIHYGISLM